MANLKVKDGDGSTKYIAKEGAGTDVDPYVEPNADAVLGTTQDIANATQATAVIVEAQAAAIGEGDDAEATGDGTLIAIVKRIRTLLAGTLTVQGTVTATVTDGATATNQTAAATLVGAVTETAPATDTASSGLNGRLQRIAQRITSMIALLPTALTGSGNFKIAVQEVGAKTITKFSTTKSSSGDNSVISAPGSGQRLVIPYCKVQNESSTATTALFKSGSTEIDRVLLQSQGDGYGWTHPRGHEVRLGENEAFVLNLSGANSHGITGGYFTEATS
jgi:hypothetical protein